MTIDPRIRRVGYAYFDGAILEDWGTRNVRANVPNVRAQRLLIPLMVTMLDRYAPTLLIVPDVRSGAVRRSRTVAEIVGGVVQEAVNRGIAVRFIADSDIDGTFATIVGKVRPNKQQINATIVRWFPELKRWLPTKRRLWDPERYGQALFHAVAQWVAWRGAPTPEHRTGT